MRGGFNKAKGVKGLAWISFGFAVVGGAALMLTPLGGLIVGLVHLLDSAVAMVPMLHIPRGVVPPLLFWGLVIAMGIDLFVDGEPNQVALYSAMALPSVAMATQGQSSATVTNASHQILAQTNAGLGAWLGTTSTIGLAVVAIAISLLMSRRVIAKGR